MNKLFPHLLIAAIVAPAISFAGGLGGQLHSPAQAISSVSTLPAVPSFTAPVVGTSVPTKVVKEAAGSVAGKALELLSQDRTQEALAYAISSYKSDPSSAYLMGKLTESGVLVNVDGTSSLQEVGETASGAAYEYFKLCHPKVLECTFEVARVGLSKGDPAAASLMRHAAMRGNPSAMSAYGSMHAAKKNAANQFMGAKWLWAAHLLGDKNAQVAFDSLKLSDKKQKDAKAAAALMAERAKVGGSTQKIRRKPKDVTGESLDPFSRALKGMENQ